MLAALLVAHLQAMSLGACPPGAVRSCTLAGCCVATQECAGTTWDPCICDVAVGQTCGATTQCTTYAYNASCQCVATVATGTTCNDGNACTTNDRCAANGSCAGTPLSTIDDRDPCTADSCNSATGVVTHTPMTSQLSTCSSGTFFCYDKYGNVTKQVVCAKDVACDTTCP
jgi:hypothetical protein